MGKYKKGMGVQIPPRPHHLNQTQNFKIKSNFASLPHCFKSLWSDSV